MSNANKNTIFVEANIMNTSAKFQLHYLIVSEEMMFEIILANSAFQIQQFGQNLYIW